MVSQRSKDRRSQRLPLLAVNRIGRGKEFLLSQVLMQKAAPLRVQLGAFEFDMKAGELRKAGAKIRLQEQPFKVLLMLVERSGKLVTLDEIKQRLWPNDTVVEFDHSIHTAIRKLRQALSDSADHPRYVETVARRGYRLIVPLEYLESTPADGSPNNADSSSDDGTAVRVQIPAVLIGKKVSHYRVLEIVGGGGMGVVYKAEDLKLGRRVALKFLPEELVTDAVTLQRFEREARVASSLNHPNICTIYEFGEHEGQPFLVMELLEGETLRELISRAAVSPGGVKAQIPLQKMLDIAVQITDGLDAAHQKGIIHRDIKPANIFLTTQGQVKILDFGLAKLTAAASEAAEELGDDGGGTQIHPQRDIAIEHSLTRTGMAMGTAGYMSPEQVRSEQLDGRTDLFSFGLILYEMATGQRAFSGNTAAILKDAILNHTPAPVNEGNSTLPAKLVTTIDKALEKNREKRYQSAAEMRADLELLAGRTRHGLVRRHWKVLASAAIVLAAVVGGLLYWRSHRTIHLSEKDTIVLADFVNSTGDPVFDGTLKQALAVQLGESPFLNVLSDKQVSASLKLMKHPETEPLTQTTAEAVCIRANGRAVLEGNIVSIGGGYQIGLKTVDCHSGVTLATAKTQSTDRTKVLSALSEAATDLRRKLGESRDSLQGFSTPLEEATTSSLDALQAYTQGRKKQAEQGQAAAIPYFKLAVEVDPNFAAAHVALGTAHQGLYEYSQAAASLKKAFDLRNRVSRRERFIIETNYYNLVTGELDNFRETLLEWARTYPRDYLPHTNVSTCYRFVGQFDKAISEARLGLDLSPDNVAAVYTLMIGYIRMERLNEAKKVYEEARARKLDSPLMHFGRYLVAFLERDDATMLEFVESAKGKPLTEDLMSMEEAGIEAYHGRFKQARELMEAATDLATKSGSPDRAALWKTNGALWEAEVGNPTRANSLTSQASALSTDQDVTINLALAYARSGNLAHAKKLADQLAREHPLDTGIQRYFVPMTRAGIALQLNQPTQAIDALSASLPDDLGPSALMPAYLRGLAYLQAGSGRQAAREFQKVIDHPGIVETEVRGALSHLQLGRAQVMSGEKSAARKSYQDFLTLWKDADPDIPIYQQAKAEYAKLK
jgi:eukaryotic-like serine/threonine-protein kinase